MPKVPKVALAPDRLDAAIARRLLTLKDLERRVQCSASTLWTARKARPIGLSVAKRLARALGCELTELLEGDVTTLQDQPGGEGAGVMAGGQVSEVNAGAALGGAAAAASG